MRSALLLALAWIAGDEPLLAAGFAPGNLFVASIDNARVYELNPDGVVLRDLGEAAGLDAPRGIAFGPDGNLYVTSGDSIVVLDAADQLVRTIVDAALVGPRGLAFGPQGHLFCTATDRIAEFTLEGALVRTFGTDAGLGVPVGMAFFANGTLVVASGAANELVLFEPGGTRIGAITPSGLSIPTAVARGPDGNLYVASLFNSTVLVLDESFATVGTITGDALAFPSGLAFGPDRNLYVTSLVTHRVVAFDPDHQQVRELTGATLLAHPEGIAFAPWRFKVKVTGSAAAVGSKYAKVKGKGVLSYLPGAGAAMVELQGGAQTQLMRPFAVIQGTEVIPAGTAKQRSLLGLEFSDATDAIVLSAMLLDITGKSIDFGPGTAFQPQKGKVAWQSTHAGVVFKGSLKITGIDT